MSNPSNSNNYPMQGGASLPVTVMNPDDISSGGGGGGDATAANQVITNDVLGAPSGAKVVTDANGTLQQYLRGLIYLLITQGAARITSDYPVVNATKSAPAAAISVTSTATQIFAGGFAGKSRTFYNNGAATMYVGNANTVTAANGYPVPAGASVTDELTSDAWWGITASGTADVRTMTAS